MAKIVMGILGGFSGRVGTVVGYHRHGAWFVRAYQPHIRDRKSAAQLEQRSRFKAMIQFAAQATPTLRVGLKAVADAQGMTEGNAFLRLNKESFAAGCARVDYPALCFSRGSLPGLRGLHYSVDGGGRLRVGWQRAGGALSDRVHIFVYCAGRGFSVEGVRQRGRVELLLPDGFAGGEPLHLWAFVGAGAGRVSNTQYINNLSNESEEGDLCDAGADGGGAGRVGCGGARAAYDAVPVAGVVAVPAQFAAPPGVVAAVVDG